MKYKNYKSAIHNFAHSFQSVDYTRSGNLAFNILIKLNNLDKTPEATFDFVNKTIEPNEAKSEESNQLLNDYLNWLPIHFKNHKCDIDKLQKLIITISADFNKVFIPPNMNYCKQINIKTKTTWKAENRDEETIDISQNELVDNKFLEIGLPEMK